MIQLITESKAFHSAFSKINIQSSRGEISLFFRQNLDFKHSLEAELSLEEEEIKRYMDLDV